MNGVTALRQNFLNYLNVYHDAIIDLLCQKSVYIDILIKTLVERDFLSIPEVDNNYNKPIHSIRDGSTHIIGLIRHRASIISDAYQLSLLCVTLTSLILSIGADVGLIEGHGDVFVFGL